MSHSSFFMEKRKWKERFHKNNLWQIIIATDPIEYQLWFRSCSHGYRKLFRLLFSFAWQRSNCCCWMFRWMISKRFDGMLAQSIYDVNANVLRCWSINHFPTMVGRNDIHRTYRCERGYPEWFQHLLDVLRKQSILVRSKYGPNLCKLCSIQGPIPKFLQIKKKYIQEKPQQNSNKSLFHKFAFFCLPLCVLLQT